MTDEPGRKAIAAFLEWAREALARDPTHWPDVEKALAETTMAPELRRVVEVELQGLAAEYPPPRRSAREGGDAGDPSARPGRPDRS